jgi:hypothetical protein
MKILNTIGVTLGVATALALTLVGSQGAMAQMGQMSHSHYASYSKHNHKHSWDRSDSGVVIGGSWGSQSAYNNHNHHNYSPQRKYYTYEGNQYYIDLNTGLRFRF